MRRRLVQLIALRRSRPALTLIAVPLAMTAAGVADATALLPPLALLAWWWTPSARTWWLSLVLGVVGTEWAFIGAYCLALFPDRRALVGALWLVFPVVLAAVSHRARMAHPGRGY